MINPQEYIESGVLELFVTGNLSESGSEDVVKQVDSNTSVKQEVEEIESAYMHLARAIAPEVPSQFDKKQYKDIGNDEVPVIPLSRKVPLYSLIGWAASLILLIGLGYLFVENQALEEKIVDAERELLLQEGKTQVAEENFDSANDLLNIIRNERVIKVPLGAQEIAPSAYAQVYWDKENGKAYVDVKGLPKPPEGKVYQVWSLTLEPLTPTSIGVLDGYDESSIQIFELDNTNASEAFGITLEPAGGSKSPTLEQLYTLGVVES